jgi:hypothetical protein
MKIIIFQYNNLKEFLSLMPAYIISYLNKDREPLITETVFMRNLAAAKTSATTTAPDIAYIIAISDVGDKILSTKEDGKWKNL